MKVGNTQRNSEHLPRLNSVTTGSHGSGAEHRYPRGAGEFGGYGTQARRRFFRRSPTGRVPRWPLAHGDLIARGNGTPARGGGSAAGGRTDWRRHTWNRTGGSTGEYWGSGSSRGILRRRWPRCPARGLRRWVRVHRRRRMRLRRNSARREPTDRTRRSPRIPRWRRCMSPRPTPCTPPTRCCACATARPSCWRSRSRSTRARRRRSSRPRETGGCS